MLSRTYRTSIAAALMLAAITGSLSGTPRVNAHGLTSPIAEGVAGPYEYVVGIWPPIPSVGDLFISITLSANQQPVTNADVTVTATVDDGPVDLEPRPAINNFLHPQSYELSMPLSTPGQWWFKIEIESPLGDAVLEVPLEITGSEGTSNDREREVATDSDSAGREAGGQQAGVREGGYQEPVGQEAAGGKLDWATIAAPLAILGFGLGIWGLRRYMRPSSRRYRRQRIRHDRNKDKAQERKKY